MTRHIFVAAALLALVALPGVSQTIQRNMKKEAMIWEQLKVIAPGSLEDFKAATTAMDSERYDEAVRLYQAVFKKAPNFDVVMRRLGMSLAQQGKVDEGLALLEKAVATNRPG
jgi:predicted negative regulator of RcsB-dependent stress response